jgi:hypothetical protein
MIKLRAGKAESSKLKAQSEKIRRLKDGSVSLGAVR